MAAPKTNTLSTLASGRARRIAGSVKPRGYTRLPRLKLTPRPAKPRPTPKSYKPKPSKIAHVFKSIFSQVYRYNANKYK